VKYRRLAKTDLDVSVVAFGCWGIVGGFNWGPQEESDSLEALRAAFDAGVNFFDTAEAYGNGKSEQLLAKALLDARDEIVIASKVSPNHFAPDELVKACERSLRNLRTDRIDLYQLHWPSRDIPLAETLGVLEKLREQGKIRFYGVSNFGPGTLGECERAPQTISSNQLAYNLLFRAIEYEILPMCVREGISVLCYSPILQGLLTGKFAAADDVPEDRARTRHFSRARPQARHGEDGAETETFAAIAQVRLIAEELRQPMADVSLAWLLAQEGVTAVLAGGRNADQARRNTRAGELILPPEAVARLSEATDALKLKLGPNADMWQGESRVH